MEKLNESMEEIIFSVQEFEILQKILKKNANIITQKDLNQIKNG